MHVPNAPHVHVLVQVRVCVPQLPQACESTWPGRQVVQGMHTPAEQMPDAPHDVPSATLPVSRHTGEPVVHVVAPVRQGLVGAQGAPSLHATQVPAPLHTRPVPHDVPPGRLPVSAHVGMPVEHVIEPVRQGLSGEHAEPAAHAMHDPAALQTMPAPHDEPGGARPDSRHTGPPVEQSTAPVRHAVVGVQLAPAEHATHDPLPLHTEPAPQAVPGGWLPASRHTEAPVEQSIAPVRHADGAMHDAPDTHAPQVPAALHTSPAPHDVPAGRLPDSRHTGAPVEQSIAPVWHGVAGVQLAPALHDTHAPAALQTMPVPHDVPAGRAAPATHTAAPVEHSTAPVRHGSDGEQLMPALHDTHAPEALHTMPAPHDVPAGRLPVSRHTEAPVEQSTAPERHAVVGVQLAPCVQATHAPEALHTMFAPHDVPAGRFAPSRHDGVPEAQSIRPLLHAVAGVQGASGVQAAQLPEASHTRPMPHDVPADRLPVGAHTGSPVPHWIAPLLHAVEGVQLMPSVQATQTAMALHTRPMPHDVPAGRAAPSRHTGAPVEHSIAPSRQGLVGVQLMPALQATHAPEALHTMPAPHDEPAGALPVSAQSGAPVEHAIEPVRHGVVGVHEAPSEHSTHSAEALQTRPSPHDMPTPRLPVSRHSAVPPEHEIVAVRQRLLVTQGVPSRHVMQPPAPSQTMPAPHAAPAAVGDSCTQRCVVSLHVVGPRQVSDMGVAMHGRVAVHVKRHPGSQPEPGSLRPSSHSSPGSTTLLPHCDSAGVSTDTSASSASVASIASITSSASIASETSGASLTSETSGASLASGASCAGGVWQ